MSVRVLGIVGVRDIAGVKYSLYQTDFHIDYNFPIKRHNIKFTLTCTCGQLYSPTALLIATLRPLQTKH